MSTKQKVCSAALRNTIATLCVALAVASPMQAFAKKGQSKWPAVLGEVTQVDQAKKSFTVKDVDGKETRFAANPGTEVEVERERPLKFVWTGDFTDVKPGSWVRVKYQGSGEVKSARGIAVFIYPR